MVETVWSMRARPCVGALMLLIGCDEAPAPPSQEARPLESRQSAGDQELAPAPMLPSAVPSAVAPAEEVSLAGEWEGRYDAKKGAIYLPSKVPDKTWKNDPGTVASGPGTIRLTITPSGEISGHGSGALGDVTCTGRVESTRVRATILPVDRAVPPSMSGVLVGLLKGNAIQATIKVAGADAAVVREAVFELQRK